MASSPDAELSFYELLCGGRGSWTVPGFSFKSVPRQRMCCALFVAMSVEGVGLWVRFVIPAAGRTGYHFDHFRFAVSFCFSFFNP